MSRILKYGLRLLVLLLVLVGLAAAYNNWAPLPSHTTAIPEQVTIPYGDSIALTQGARLVSMTCVNCHRGEDGKLTGQPMPADDFGQFYVGNITNDAQTGLGRYTDEELIHLLRTGVRPDGTMCVPIMPRFFKMSDEDLHSIVAYLRSDAAAVQAVEKQWPEQQPSFLAKALMRLAFKPVPMPDDVVTAPPPSDLLARGEYLADYVYDCYKCHSASFESNNELEPALSQGFYGGGNPFMGFDGTIVPSANLTQHPAHGLGEWTEADFARALRQKIRPDGQMLSSAMPAFTALTDEEVAALWAYLQSVPIQENPVLTQQAQ